MSQQVFADRLGKSKSWADKVERGVRRLDKFSVLHEIADVLHIDVQLLLGKAPERQSDPPGSPARADEVDLTPIRTALERYEMIDIYLGGSRNPPEVKELPAALGHAWHAYQRSDYPTLTKRLPALLLAAQTADAMSEGDGASRAAHLLGQVYQAISATLCKLGEHHLAWLAADRATAMAPRAGDPLLAATAAAHVSSALLALGRARPALEVAITTAHQLERAGAGDQDPVRRLVHGVLLLQAIMAAARMGDSSTVRDLFVGAEGIAILLGCDENHHGTAFGPTILHLYRAAAVELGEGQQAVDIHEDIGRDAFNALMPEQRANHLLDVARAHAQLGDTRAASQMLVQAHQIATGEIRYRPLAHQIVTDILRRTSAATPTAVAELAKRIGVVS